MRPDNNKRWQTALTCVAGGFAGAWLGYTLYEAWDCLVARPELYAAYSAPWYTGPLLLAGQEYPVFVDGKFELLLPEDEHIFAYTRTDGETEALICANFTGKNVKCPIIGKWKDAQVLIHNYEKEVEEELEPYEAVILVECL